MTPEEATVEVVKLSTALAESADSDILFFAAPIGDEALEGVETSLAERANKRTNLLLMITTEGGDPHCAFRIVKRLWSAYPKGKIVALVHSVCASAGTLMVIGASELVMSDSAELGPLDIQLAKQDDLIARMSGLTPTKALETLRKEAFSCFQSVFLEVQQRSQFRITLRTASDIAVRLTAGLYEHLFSQIDPFRVAEVQRDNEIAKEYGGRLDKYKNLKENGLFRLINGYPAHELIIDREEASSIFKKLREPTEAELKLATFLQPIFTDSLRNSETYVEFVNPEVVTIKPTNTSPEEQANESTPTTANEVAEQAAISTGNSGGSTSRRRNGRQSTSATDAPQPK